jgi:hypothetical protein
MTLKQAAAQIRAIAADLRSPFSPGDYIPGTIEDALEALEALAAEMESR